MDAYGFARSAGLGDGLVAVGGRRNRYTNTTLRADEVVGLEALYTVGYELEIATTEIIRAADPRVTRFPGILRRLIKKCTREPESKEQHRYW